MENKGLDDSPLWHERETGMLRFQGHTIINIGDFKRYFDFDEIGNQIEKVISFLEIHCISIQLEDKENKPAVYLDSWFWIELLKDIRMQEKNNKSIHFADVQDYIAGKCIQFYERDNRWKQIKSETMINVFPLEHSLWAKYVEEAIEKLNDYYDGAISKAELEEMRRNLQKPFVADKEYGVAVKAEIKKWNLQKLWTDIQRTCPQYRNQKGKLLIYLSVLILTESTKDQLKIKSSISDATKQNPAVQAKHSPDVQTKSIPTVQTKPSMTTAKKNISVPELIGEKALREKTEKISCRKEPYVWAVYEEDKIEIRERIQTIRIEALKGSYGDATIQFFSLKNNKVEHVIKLKPGEYTYCNVTSQGVICVLSMEAESTDKKISMPARKPGTIYVWNKKDGKKEELKYGTEVTCFDVLGDDEIFLRNGKPITERYTAMKVHSSISRKLDVISYEEFVEVVLLPGGFLLLNNKGTIRSNLPEWNGKKAVTLRQRKG